YRLCKLFIFASLHEGFGLPVLEAMSCGAPVIGSNVTSIPEVIGNPEALFVPYSVSSMRDKIAQCLTDDTFLARLKDMAQQQA
uniref:glycosyltransferase n=1 Tax=Escherichia coli TaxID=562 RepID=UPI0023600828